MPENSNAAAYIREGDYTRVGAALCSRRDLGAVRAGAGARADRLGRPVLRVPVARGRARRRCARREGCLVRGLIALACVILPPVAHATPGQVIRIEHHDPHAPPSRGSAAAPVTIELFFIPSSTNRAQIRLLEQLQAEHPSRIRLVYRVLLRGAAGLASLAALEADAQG